MDILCVVPYEVHRTVFFIVCDFNQVWDTGAFLNANNIQINIAKYGMNSLAQNNNIKRAMPYTVKYMADIEI